NFGIATSLDLEQHAAWLHEIARFDVAREHDTRHFGTQDGLFERRARGGEALEEQVLFRAALRQGRCLEAGPLDRCTRERLGFLGLLDRLARDQAALKEVTAPLDFPARLRKPRLRLAQRDFGLGTCGTLELREG